MVGWFHSEITSLSKRLANECLDSGQLTSGHFTLSLENQLSQLLDVRHCLYTNSGTSALAMALIASGISSSTNVTTSGIGWVATPQAIQLSGATPTIVDVLPDLPLIDISLIKDDCDIVIPVNYNGRQVDIDSLKNSRPNLVIIEDSCKSLFSRDFSGKNFSGTNGHFGCYSLGMISALPGIYGGIVSTNDDDHIEPLNKIKMHGVSYVNKQEEYAFKSYNFKSSNIHAAIALGMLDSFQARLDRLKTIYSMYKDGLDGLVNNRLLPVDIEGGQVSLLIDVVSTNRAHYVSHMNSQDLLTCNYHNALSSAPGVTSNFLKNSEFFASSVFHPPCGPDQDLRTVERAIKVLQSFG